MKSEIEQYIKDHFDEMSCETLRKKINQEFGTSYKTTTFHYHTKRLGLSKYDVHDYTEEQDAFLRDNSCKMTKKELTDAFNEKYGTKINVQAIVQRCFLRKWGAKSDGKFKRGSVPWEKSKGGRDEFVKKLKGGNSGSFKKGFVPHNTVDVGTTRLWGHEIKVKTDNGWKNRLRYMWEQKYGEIPDGCIVTSVNGNSLTNDIEELRMMPNQIWTVLMANDWNGKGDLIMDAGIAWSELYLILKMNSNTDEMEDE